MASKEVRVFSLGTGGVNLTKSPLELADDELIQAQNAEPFRERGVAGIRKRSGLQRVVPTGSVTPSAAAAGIGGIIPLQANFGPVTAPGMQRIYQGISGTTGILSADGGTTFSPYTGSTTTAPTPLAPYFGIAANTKYNLNLSTSYEFVSLYPAVRIWNWLIFGGHESGQVLGFDGTTVRELKRLTATGAVDDCLPLPGYWTNDEATTIGTDQFGNAVQQLTGRVWVVIAIVGGGVQLFDVLSGDVKVLPTLAATVTGAAGIGRRLWVASGLSVYSIDVQSETAWTTAFTTADAGVSQLTGLQAYDASLYVGTKTTSVSVFLRMYRLTTNLNGTATKVQSGGQDALMISQTTAPSYLLGPLPGGDAGHYAIYRGTSSAVITGYRGGGGNTLSSKAVLHAYNVSAATWDTNLEITTALGSSTNITIGSILPFAFGVYFYARFNTTDFGILVSSFIYPYGGSTYSWLAQSLSTLAGDPTYPLLVG